MLDEIKKVLSGIRKDTEKAIRELTENHLRCERYDVTTAPNGSVIGVTQPFGDAELLIPYSWMCSNAAVGDSVIVVWWNTLSTAQAWFMGGGWVDHLLSIETGGGGITVNGNLTVKGSTAPQNGFIPISVSDCDAALTDAPANSLSFGFIATGAANAPFTGNGILLTHRTGVGTWASQLAFGDRGTFYRARQSGVWGAWNLISPIAAYVTESGTSGMWTYRKWSDGTAECWCSIYSDSVPVAAASGALYKEGTQHTVAFPSGLFSDRPVVVGSVSDDWYASTPLFWLRIVNTAAANVVYETWASQSVTRSLRVELYARSA